MGLVSKIVALTHLSPEGKEWLEAHMEVKTLAKNAVVLQEHEVCEYLYFVRSGMLCSYYHQGVSESSKEICNWLAMEDDFATAYYSFISRKPSYEIIESIEETVVEAISYKNMQRLYQLFPETEKAGRIILEEYYLRIEEHLFAIRFKDAKERYETFAQGRSQLVARAPLGRIASYLGMTQETLSRVRAAYREKIDKGGQ